MGDSLDWETHQKCIKIKFNSPSMNQLEMLKKVLLRKGLSFLGAEFAFSRATLDYELIEGNEIIVI